MISSIIEDLKEDEKLEYKVRDKGYLFSSVVNYPNNKSLVRQNVYVNSKGDINKVEVVDKEGNPQIIMKFNKQEYNKKFDKDYFELNSLLKINQDDTIQKKKTNENSTNSSSGTNTSQSSDNKQDTQTETTASIKDIVYPMYLPSNTYLTSQEKINTKDGERLILTFGGDSSFVLVEEVGKIDEEDVVIPVSGEFDFLTDVIGIIDTHSLSWHSNGIDYYIASDVIETSELIDIARSINILPVSK